MTECLLIQKILFKVQIGGMILPGLPTFPMLIWQNVMQKLKEITENRVKKAFHSQKIE